MFYWHAYCNFISFYSLFGTIDFHKRVILYILSLNRPMTMTMTLTTTSTTVWALFVSDNLLLSLMHSTTTQHHHFHFSYCSRCGARQLDIFPCTTQTQQHTARHLCIHIRIIITIPFQIQRYMCVSSTNTTIDGYTICPKKHSRPKSDKIIKSPVAIPYRWPHTHTKIDFWIQIKVAHRDIVNVSALSSASYTYISSLLYLLHINECMNEWMCVSVCSWWCLQFILINIGCMKATQTQGINGHANNSNVNETAACRGVRSEKRQTNDKIWMNAHTYLRVYACACMCLCVGRPYVGIFYRWHHFSVPEFSKSRINEGRSKAQRDDVDEKKRIYK